MIARSSPDIYRHRHPAHTEAGFSLIEVLVSVLVLAAGLIGAAMMQLSAGRTTQQSSFHDTALTLAMQVADEIRANDAQARVTGVTNPFLAFSYTAQPTQPAAAPTNCFTQACTSAQIAQHTAAEWQRRVYDALPGGRLEICRDATVVTTNGNFAWCGIAGAVGDPVAIKIGWTERDADGKVLGSAIPQLAVVFSPFSQ